MSKGATVRTRFVKPPEYVTPELAEARRQWYASNPWKPDWRANERALKGAHDCMREKGAA